MAPKLKCLLRHVDQTTVSARARSETRNREVSLPPISVYRWWARRTDAVNDALLKAAAQELEREGHLLVADPFAGGGVIPLAALKRGHSVYAQDVNPWVAQGLSVMLGLPSQVRLKEAGDWLLERCEPLAAKAYGTTFSDGAPAQVAHAIRVAVADCSRCGNPQRLFHSALVSRTKRRERGGSEAMMACRRGHLFLGDATEEPACPDCTMNVDPAATYLPDRIATCPSCGHQESLEARAHSGAWRWELVLIERSDGGRREFGIPTDDERLQGMDESWNPRRKLGAIPEAPETRVLRRHGFTSWSDIYPKRQRYVMEQLLKQTQSSDLAPNVRAALNMAVLGTAEMAGFLSRWDRYYLKSYESMASHRFNFTTLAVEPNIIGAGLHGRGTLRRRLELFKRAAQWYADKAIRVRPRVLRQADQPQLRKKPTRRATIVVGSSERVLLPDSSVDLVLTDPPYHDDVQYHELSLPFRAWANLTRGRVLGEAVGIPHSASLLGHRRYRGILQRIFTELNRVLKPDGRLLFSYANREPAAWVNLFAALQASGLQPVGYTILHSENESVHAKRNGRACDLDIILELAPAGGTVVERWRPSPLFDTDEERFLMTVGDAFLDSASMTNGWEVEMVSRLRSEIFVRPKEVVGGTLSSADSKKAQEADRDARILMLSPVPSLRSTS